MTPQAFSYPAVASNGFIYVPPYGLTQSINFMLKIDPDSYQIKKISLKTDASTEKWIVGIAHEDYIYFLPYNESKIIILDTKTDDINYIELQHNAQGKYIQGHLYKDQIIALPYGEPEFFDYALHINLKTKTAKQVKLNIPSNDNKLWHTTQLVDGIIHGLPRGAEWDKTKGYFPYRIEYSCEDESANFIDISYLWKDYDDQNDLSNTKFTTIAKVDNKLFAPPYCQNPNFDIIAKYIDGEWQYERTELKKTSRKYFTHVTAKNGKIYFPPAGHEDDWAEMLIINSDTNEWYVKDLGIGKESKKYFAGLENSNNKLYFMPRGGCVCEPEEVWKQNGDLAEILVVVTKDDSFYTIDISEYFVDNTTIEKYNKCVIVDDVIFAFPYGESDTFQTVLVFDTLTEKIVKTIDLNEI